LIFLPWMYTSQ